MPSAGMKEPPVWRRCWRIRRWKGGGCELAAYQIGFFVVFNLVMVVALCLAAHMGDDMAMHKHEGHRRDGRGR